MPEEKSRLSADVAVPQREKGAVVPPGLASASSTKLAAKASEASPPPKNVRSRTRAPRAVRAEADKVSKDRPSKRTKVSVVIKRPRAAFNAAVHPGKLAVSHAKAEKAFKSFTLSRFGLKSRPEHYKAPGEHITVAQKRTIAADLKKQKAAAKSVETPQRALTLALPKDVLKEVLPSHKRNRVDLDEVMTVLTRYVRGRELVANGDPTLNRLALQAQIAKMFASITSAQTTKPAKKGAKK